MKRSTQNNLADVELVRPFTFIREGDRKWGKLPHYMPFGPDTLPRLCTVDALDQWELSGLQKIPLRDANGIDFMLTFKDFPRGLWGTPRFQAWKLSKTRRRNRK